MVLAGSMLIGMMGMNCAAAESFTFASWALAEETLEPTYRAMAESFMEKNPDIAVELDGSQAYATYLDQLLISAISQTAPNVAHIKTEWLPQLLDTGAVRAVVGISEEVLNDYSAEAIEGVTIDGEMMAMPWFSNTYALYCNTALAEQAGVDIDAITCWADLVTAAEQISALGDDIYGLALPDSEVEAGEGYNVLPLLWAHGGELISDGQIQLTSEAAIEAYTEIQQLYQKNISPKGMHFKELRNLFGQGKIGFYYDLQATIATAASAAENEDEFYENFRCIVIPGQEDAYGAGYQISHLLVVFNTTTDEQMPAVSSFLEHMSSDEVIRILYEAGQGKMSNRSSVNQSVFADADEITQIYVKAMETSRPLPTSQMDVIEADTAMVKALTCIANGEDVTQVLGALQEELQTMVY